MARELCDRLGPGQVCEPHLHIAIGRRLIGAGLGVVAVLWLPLFNRLKAGAGIHEVQAVITGTGIVFLIIAGMSVVVSVCMDEDHFLKYLLSGAGIPAFFLGIISLAQVVP
jgi:hypothetical protein